MNITFACHRQPDIPTAATLDEYLDLVALRWTRQDHTGALDIIAALLPRYADQSIRILARAHQILQELEGRSRYELYQKRILDFPIQAGDKVLDIGSGHLPFPLATHLADISVTDDQYGRAGIAFRHIDGKPVYQVPLEDTGFADKEFDFVYCSHVLEHSTDPEKACRELIRIAKRGYIETPSPMKDFLLQMAVPANHRWGVELAGDTLVITEYTPQQIAGIGSDVLLHMCCDPVTEREKAFYALLLLLADRTNTMLMWQDSFDYAVRRATAAGRMRRA